MEDYLKLRFPAISSVRQNDLWISCSKVCCLRVEILESQLSTYGKSMGEDKLREETKKLMEDKEAYQLAAKLNIKKLGNHILTMEQGAICSDPDSIWFISVYFSNYYNYVDWTPL